MLYISYQAAFIFISLVWCLLRAAIALKNKHFLWKRELALLLVYICIVVVVRFTFFPFFKENGNILPLVFDAGRVFPFRINLVPFVNLFDYPSKKEILINIIGNSAMFIPLGIVWPLVFKELDSHVKVILAGIGCSLVIELLQLPIFERVSDIDDLLLNSAGYVLGYLIYLMFSRWGRRARQNSST